jgi:signal transduction histidine kinase/AmiR/NasT family two-component response regulator
MSLTTGRRPEDVTAPDMPEAVRPLVEAELLRLLYRQLPAALWGTLLSALVVMAVLWGRTSAAPLMAWAALVLAITGSRALLWRRFRALRPDGSALARWRRWFWVGVALSGASWGLASVVLAPADSPVHEVFLTFVLGGMTAGALGSMAAWRGAYGLFLVLVLAPLALRGVMLGDGIHLGMAALVSLFGGILWVISGRMHGALRESLALRFQNLDLVGSLAVAKARQQVANARLEEALRAAEASARAKSEFLANIGHEVRTPMNGVLGTLELLGDTELGPEQREYLSMARGSALGLMGLLDDILDFSNIDAGRLHLEAVATDLRSALREAVDSFAAAAREKGLELTLGLDEGLPARVLFDPRRLRQVLTNLVGNAVKFTERGSVQVVVEQTREDGGRVGLHFAVRDTGIGVPVEQQGRIFDVFTQADGSTTRRYGGTGLGLAISKRLVELMGGRIGVDSRPGRGSTFWFTLTARVAGEVATADVRRTDARVLLVEDNPVNRQIARRLLEKRGLAVICVEDGQQALQRLAEGGFDLVLMDCQMPVLDGLDATRRFRAREAAEAHGGDERLPIVALTAGAMDADRESCLAAGMDDYLVKPFKAVQLDAILARWLRRGDGVARLGQEAG